MIGRDGACAATSTCRRYAPTTLRRDPGPRRGAAGAPLAQLITALENGKADAALLKAELHDAAERRHVPVLGITGTGGAGKSR